MFDWFWRTLGYELKKDKRAEYVDKCIKEEEEQAIYEKKVLILKPLSQKQKSQQKSYANAVSGTCI
tara:strand:- start:288 stop:485 length:198 start_codon:yes stop_codon:yes gene_type:complete